MVLLCVIDKIKRVLSAMTGRIAHLEATNKYSVKSY